MAPLIIEDELLEKGLIAFEDAIETLDATGAVPAVSHHGKVASTVPEWHPSAEPEFPMPGPMHPHGPRPGTEGESGRSGAPTSALPRSSPRSA